MDSRGSSETEDRDHGWFAARNRGTPPEAFDDVTQVREPELDLEIEVDEPPPLPARTVTPPPTVSQDRRFAELNAIVGHVRALLAETGAMNEPEIDALEWKLRQRVARL